MSAAENQAVFLSYASQDAEAVERIAAALRAAGVEVWFDKNELTGGDAWDQKIRGQIKSCALFMPVISAATNARREGYFRREWKIAIDRTHDMDEALPFLLPVVIDETPDASAFVPEKFREVQWTRLIGGETPEKFCARVRNLLGGSVIDVAPGALASVALAKEADRAPGHRPGRQQPGPHSRLWLIPATLVVAALVIWRPWQRKEPAAAIVTPTAPAAAALPASSTEIARIRTRLIPDQWQKGDFEALSPTLDRIIQANPEDSDAWAIRSIVNSMQVSRNFDSGTKPLEAGRAAADRALRLAPNSPWAELALGLHLNAMISRGGDPAAGRPHVARALAALPPDPITRYAGLITEWQGYNAAGTERVANAWLAVEPKASYPAWILAQLEITLRRPTDAERWAETAAADSNITGARALYTLFESKYYLRADLAAATAALDRVPPEWRSVHRDIHGRWLLAMAEQHWDQALQELARVSEAMLYDRTYHGPRSLLAGLAHQRAGRADAALAQFRESERLLRAELATDTDNEELHLALAVTLACAGRAADARGELAFVEPLLKGRAPSIYWGAEVICIAQAYGVLGDFGHMAGWLRKLFVERSGYPFTSASVRFDPRFAGTLDAPEIQALLKEFASLDQPKENPATVAPDLSAAALAKVDDKSVAVLAFADLSAAHDSEYFSDGISEELINALGKVPGLKVPARTSSFHFKGKDTPIPEIAKQLGVAYVIEGSVQRLGDKVKIGARLTKAADGFQVWTDSFTREAKDVFAVEEEIAGIIAKNFSLKLGASSAAATASVNPQALEFYLQANRLMRLRDTIFTNTDRVEALLNRALALEPNFARAQAMLAEVWVARGSFQTSSISRFGQRLSPEAARIETKARQAIALDPTAPEAHVALATGMWIWWDRAGAENEIRTALSLNPSHVPAHRQLGVLAMDDGRMDDAIAELQLAVQLDPLSQPAIESLARALHVAGRYTEAIATYDRALALADSEVAREHKAYALAQLGQKEAAVALTRSLSLDWLRFRTFAATGDRVETEKMFPAIAPENRAYYLFMLGRTEEGLAALNPAEMESTYLHDVLFEPWYDPVREDPRFKKFLETLGVTEAHARAQAWRKAHPPEKNPVQNH